MNGKNKAAAVCAAVIAVIVLIAVLAASGRRETINAEPSPVTGKEEDSSAAGQYEESYREYLSNAEYAGKLSDKEVTVKLSDFTASEEGAAEMGEEGILTADEGMVSWSFDVFETGFYNLEIGYISLPGTTSDIQRRLYIDGEFPYNALSQVVLKRWWEDEDIRTKNKNEIRPGSNELYHRNTLFLEDYGRRNNEPLIFYLEKGKHTLSLEVIKEPLEVTSLIFKAAEKPAGYSESIEKLKVEYPVYSGDSIICQAERKAGGTERIIKSSSSINIQKNYSDSSLQPYHPYRIVYNTIGAQNWAQPGDSITWEVEAPAEGLYELTFKGRQNLNRGVTSYRRLYVNGAVPYEEANAVGFSYSAEMNNYTLTDGEGEPYLFYLKAGKNTVTLENVMGPMGDIISRVEESMKALNQIYLEVIRLTGQVPDKFIDYEIAKKIPDFSKVMEIQSAGLNQAVEDIVAITGEKGENTSLLGKMALEAAALAEDPESVTEELNQLKNNISALGTWLVNISSMPLEIDYLVLSGQGGKLPEAREPFTAGVTNSIIRFASTFFVKNSQISEDSQESGSGNIKVWMASFGKEQAQIIQNMIDESFTPESDINVNLQLIPVDVVLRAALAGNGPDVVIGLNQATMQDFAMRDAVVDLSGLEGFGEVTQRFYDSVIDTARFGEGVYGIPEQATFMMMFVRNDIMKELGLEAPETWEEFRTMLPVLQKNNYNVYLPNVQQTETGTNSASIAYNMNLYLSMVEQNGGEIYLGGDSDYGIESGLAQDNAMTAFKEYTDFFTSYGLDVQVDFTNRFRAGEIPVGITGYTTFNQLEIFAPEIKGLWSFYPVPGTRKDGTVDHSFLVDTVQSVIMSSGRKQEAAWEFVKWWTGTDTQLGFANSLEALMGTSARYAAADPEVLRQLPWSNEELKALLDQYEMTTGIRAVPGSYMTTRMVQYSFNDVVAENANPRESLYLKVKDINQELDRKRLELRLPVAKQGE